MPVRQALQQQQAWLPSTAAALHTLQHSQQAWQASVARTLFSSAEGTQGGAGNQQPKSMLDAGFAVQGAAAEVLGSAAAAARMQAGAEQGEKSLLRRLFGALFDVTMIAALGATMAGGYYYYRYLASCLEFGQITQALGRFGSLSSISQCSANASSQVLIA